MSTTNEVFYNLIEAEEPSMWSKAGDFIRKHRGKISGALGAGAGAGAGVAAGVGGTLAAIGAYKGARRLIKGKSRRVYDSDIRKHQATQAASMMQSSADDIQGNLSESVYATANTFRRGFNKIFGRKPTPRPGMSTLQRVGLATGIATGTAAAGYGAHRAYKHYQANKRSINRRVRNGVKRAKSFYNRSPLLKDMGGGAKYGMRTHRMVHGLLSNPLGGALTGASLGRRRSKKIHDFVKRGYKSYI